MKSLEDQLSKYARYHRDRRNILTHMVGIPLIVFGLALLLAWPLVTVQELTIPAVALLALPLALYYLRLDWRYGLVMMSLLALAVAGAHQVDPVGGWRRPALGIVCFVVGWVFQFLGHYWEGRKPAFVDDLMGLAIGPLFVVAEAGFLLRFRIDLQRRIEVRLAHPRQAG